MNEILKISTTLSDHVCLFGKKSDGIDDVLGIGEVDVFPMFVFRLRDDGALDPVTNANTLFVMDSLLAKTVVLLAMDSADTQPITLQNRPVHFDRTENFEDFLRGISSAVVRKELSRRVLHFKGYEVTIVLDIDESLLQSRTFSQKRWETLSRQRPDLTKFVVACDWESANDRETIKIREERIVVLRPHLDTFLEFCFRNFRRVMVWSAGVSFYVQMIVHTVFLTRGFVPFSVLTRNNVRSRKGLFLKPLHWIVDEKPHVSPLAHAQRSFAKSVFIVDDNVQACSLNCENLICLKPFVPFAEDDNGPPPKPQKRSSPSLSVVCSSSCHKVVTDTELLDVIQRMKSMFN